MTIAKVGRISFFPPWVEVTSGFRFSLSLSDTVLVPISVSGRASSILITDHPGRVLGTPLLCPKFRWIRTFSTWDSYLPVTLILTSSPRIFILTERCQLWPFIYCYLQFPVPQARVVIITRVPLFVTLERERESSPEGQRNIWVFRGWSFRCQRGRKKNQKQRGPCSPSV